MNLKALCVLLMIIVIIFTGCGGGGCDESSFNEQMEESCLTSDMKEQIQIVFDECKGLSEAEIESTPKCANLLEKNDDQLDTKEIREEGLSLTYKEGEVKATANREFYCKEKFTDICPPKDNCFLGFICF